MNEQENLQYIQMTQTPVPALILRLAVPTIISMLVTNIYNTADTFFVGKLGNSASGAVGIVFSLMAVLQALGFMCGHGCGSMMSRHLGKREYAVAAQLASTGFVMSLIFGTGVGILGLLFLEPLMIVMGSTQTILPYAKDYGICILAAAPFLTASCVLNNVLRYEGKASLAMVGLTSGAVLNIIGDPIFIFYFRLGTLGAGISTALSQAAGFFILLWMFGGTRTVTKIKLGAVSLTRKNIRGILGAGFPSLLRSGLSSISGMALNSMARLWGDAAIAAMSIVTRTAMLMFSVALGIGQGFQPVCAFNFGAGLYRRVKQGFYFTVLGGTLVLGFLGSICFLFAPWVVGVFRDDAAVVEIGSFALKAQCLVMVFQPWVLAASMLFQSTGKNKAATFMASLRSGLCFLPLILTLPLFLKIRGIQISQPLADVLSMGVSIPPVLKFFQVLESKE